MQWSCISGTNMFWYIIHLFLIIPIFVYFPLTFQFLFLGTPFRIIPPKSIQRRGRTYQLTIFYKLFLDITISISFKNLIANIISDHFIFHSPTNFLKQIIKHSVKLEREIPISQVSGFWCQGRMVFRKIGKCPSCEQLFHLGILFSCCSLTYSIKNR